MKISIDIRERISWFFRIDFFIEFAMEFAIERNRVRGSAPHATQNLGTFSKSANFPDFLGGLSPHATQILRMLRQKCSIFAGGASKRGSIASRKRNLCGSVRKSTQFSQGVRAGGGPSPQGNATSPHVFAKAPNFRRGCEQDAVHRLNISTCFRESPQFSQRVRAVANPRGTETYRVSA